jgi:hypothetical protein
MAKLEQDSRNASKVEVMSAPIEPPAGISAAGHNPPPALQKMIGRRSTITMMKIWPTLPGMPPSEVS